MINNVNTGLTDPLNLMTENRWIAQIPTRFLSNNISKQDHIILNLQDFTIPGFGTVTNTVHQHGYGMEVPALTRELSKEISFTYLLDSALTQYKWLYNWHSKLSAPDCGAGMELGDTLADYVIPIHVHLISEFKNPVVSFRFDNCFIKNLGELRLSYTGSNEPVSHTFTLNFTHMTLVDKFDDVDDNDN